MTPTLDGLLAGLVAIGFAAGLLTLALYLRGVPPRAGRPPARFEIATRALRSPALTGRVAAGVVIGVLTLVLTRWPVAALGVTALVVWWPQLFGGQRAEQRQIVRLQALVMWTESLRDTISARASLEMAIPASAGSAPPAIRPALTRLVGLVRARVPLDRALLALSVELDDASADKVIGSLILNVRQRGAGLGAVLSSLAAAGRAELDQRRRISAGRASMRRSVQLVVAITLLFAVFLVIFSRAYVAPYASVGGQLTLAVVLGVFGASFVWMRRLAGGETARPFLARDAAAVDEADLRVIAHLTGLNPTDAQTLTTAPHLTSGQPPTGTRTRPAGATGAGRR